MGHRTGLEFATRYIFPCTLVVLFADLKIILKQFYSLLTQFIMVKQTFLKVFNRRTASRLIQRDYSRPADITTLLHKAVQL